jgi:hypothetical protein
MQRFFKVSSHLALATLLGLAMSACVGIGQANAQGNQGKMKKDKPAKTRVMDDRKMDDHKMMSSDMMDDDDDLTVPVSPAYPNAAPGSLHLYHWRDYTRMEREEGSAMDARSERMMHRDKMMRDRDKMASSGSNEDEDEMNTIPLTPGYPNVAPGSLNLLHWKDYTRMELEQGSATDVKSDKMMKRDKMMRDRDKMMSHSAMDEDEEMNTLPLTPGYPNAAPGSVNLYHWKDYTRMETEPGSATEAKSDKMMKKDKMMRDRDKKMK